MPRKRPPLIGELMSRLPHELSRYDNVARARAVLALADVHHLPVLDGARLYGIVSSRDVAQSIKGSVLVGEICERDVVTVAPTDTVVDAARALLRRKIGSTVVMDGATIVGIFTTSDALAALIRAYGPADAA